MRPPVSELYGLVQQSLVVHGTPAHAPACVVEALIDAHVLERSGHGVVRLPDYIAQVQSGKIDGQGSPRT